MMLYPSSLGVRIWFCKVGSLQNQRWKTYVLGVRPPWYCKGNCKGDTLDVSCCVLFANRIGRAPSSGNRVQIPWQAWHFVRCDANWRKPRTKHRFWGSKFERFLRKLLGKPWFWSYKVSKLGKSHKKCSFCCSRVSRLSFSKVSKQVVMSFCVAVVALCDIPTCLITCRKWQN